MADLRPRPLLVAALLTPLANGICQVSQLPFIQYRILRSPGMHTVWHIQVMHAAPLCSIVTNLEAKSVHLQGEHLPQS